MKYDAVTLDTNIFDQKNLNLERGVLALFTQFAEGSAQFVLSEIVQKEVLRHLKSDAERAKQQLDSALRQSGLAHLFKPVALESLQTLTSDVCSASEAASKSLSNWLDHTHCEVVAASNANIERLISMYFESEAPFDEGKKHGFPDAIALITLEDWARQNEKRLLAITRDKGWISFCKKSDWIDTETDVSNALQRFQEHTASARRLVSDLLHSIATGQRQDIKSQLEKRLDIAVANVEPDVDADSDRFYWNVEYSVITITDVDPLTSDDSFKIIRTQSDRFVAQLKVAISAEVLVRFEYYADGRLSRHVGGSQESMNTEFLADVLVTIRGDSVDDCAIHYVEVADADVHLDFGDIVPDDSEYEE